MLKIVNLLLIIASLINAVYIINQRFIARQLYTQLAELQERAKLANDEYTRLQLEVGTYSSGLAMQGYASANLGLIQADKQHVVELR
jgi:cell division protein FtsL